MVRPRGWVRDQFGPEIEAAPPLKSKRVLCVHCNRSVSYSTSNMKTHTTSCDKMVRSIGQLPAQSNVSGSSVSGSATPDSSCSVKSVLRQLNGKSYPSLGKHEKLSIDRKFVKALHETATAFAMFDHPSWQEFFAEGMPTWCTPSPLAISTHLLCLTSMTQFRTTWPRSC